MKIVAIVGSPHGAQGNTARLTALVAAGAEDEGAAVETVFLRHGEIAPCVACDVCHRDGTCAQDDDFESLRQRIVAADGVILASPNYIFNVSAQLKAFMDRCCGIIHTVGFEKKYGVSVVTSGGGEEEPVAAYMNQFLLSTGIRPVGAVWATMGAGSGRPFSPDVEAEARSLGARLVNAWQQQELPEATEVALTAFKERMRALVIWQQKVWPYEYRYWQRHHGLE